MVKPQLAETDAFVAAVEDFNRFFIRLSGRSRLSFSTLSLIDSLASRGGPARLTDLTKTEQVSQPRLTQLIAQLELDGMVEREPDPHDRRAKLIRLTPTGRRVTASRHRDRTRRLHPLIAELSDEERGALAAAVPVLRKLADAAERAFLAEE